MKLDLPDLKVLVVEDTPNAMKMLTLMLKDMGIIQVYTAMDGREAQKFLDEALEVVDMILCDWRMPNMTGLELLQQVRTVYPEMPFIMITANDDVDSVKAAKQFGVNAYIRKPYSPEQLEKKIRTLVAQL